MSSVLTMVLSVINILLITLTLKALKYRYARNF